MYAFAVRRLVGAILTLFFLVSAVFVIMRLLPGDPATSIIGVNATQEDLARVRSIWGLDKPLLTQYGAFLSQLVQGNLGLSFKTRRPALSMAARRFVNSLKLSGIAVALSIVVGIPIGVFASVGSDSLAWIARILMISSYVGSTIPVFWAGLLLMLLFAVKLRVLPTGGIGTWKHMVLPSLTLSIVSVGILARQTRASMAEALRKDFVTTARSKGLRETRVVTKHALRSALIPVMTMAGMQFGILLGGAVLTETVFSWPGLGYQLVDSILSRDYAVIQSGILIFGGSFILINLLVDILYCWADPRIRL